MTDSTDAGGVTHLEAYKALQGLWRVAIDAPELLTLKAYIDTQESALATLTRERDGLRGAVLAILNYPGESARLRDAVGSILYDRLVSWLDVEPATPPAPLPGGQGPVEALGYAETALKNSNAASRDDASGAAFRELRIAVRHILQHLKEQGGEGREG